MTAETESSDFPEKENEAVSVESIPKDVSPTAQDVVDDLSNEAVAVQPVEFAPLDTVLAEESKAEDDNAANNNISMLHDVPLLITVELGRTQMSVGEVLNLRHGSVVELDRLAGEPVDVRVNDRLIAQGEVVVIEDKFGIRILDITSTRK